MAVGWGSCGGLQALPPALTFTSCLCRAPGICQAPERELPGCGWVSAPLENAEFCCQPGWAPLPSIQSVLQLRVSYSFPGELENTTTSQSQGKPCTGRANACLDLS